MNHAVAIQSVRSDSLLIARATFARLKVAVLMFFVAAALAPASCLAHKLALLVGVSTYSTLPPANALKGPGPDVRIMRDQLLPLLGFERDRINVLADGISGTPRPTSAAIRGAAEHLIATAANGDTALIYLAGHGSLLPAKPEEIGGVSVDTFNAIFLPADVKPSKDGLPSNVIQNHEISGWVQALRDKGVFVWLVVDACYSGYIDRAFIPGVNVHDRMVDPEVLGKNMGTQSNTVANAAKPKLRGLDSSLLEQTGQTKAGYVGFFASQSTEKTPEYSMPDATSEVHGLFTYTLVQVIARNPSGTFAQFRDGVLREYALMRRDSPTPTVVGTTLDATVAGSSQPIRQWRIVNDPDRGLMIGAGQLNGVSTNSKLLVVNEPFSKDNQTRGLVTATESTATESLLSPVLVKGRPPLDPKKIANSFARLAEPAASLTLKVGLPTAAAVKPESAKTVAFLVEKLRSTEQLGGLNSAHIDWVDVGSRASDVTLVVDDSRVWFAAADGAYFRESDHPTFSIEIGDTATLATRVWDALQRMARATNLTRLATLYNTKRLQDLELSLHLKTKATGNTEQISPGELRRVSNGDKLEVLVSNRSSWPVDVTVLYLDSDFRVQCLFPRGGQSPRLAPTVGVKSLGATFNSKTSGFEHLLVIASQGRSTQPAADYSFVADADMGQERSLTGRGLEDAVAKAGFSRMNARELVVDPQDSSTSWIGDQPFAVMPANKK
jgi:Caspase domain